MARTNWGRGLGALGQSLMAYGVHKSRMDERQKARDDAAERQTARDAEWMKRLTEQNDRYDAREQARRDAATQDEADRVGNLIPPSQPGFGLQLNPTGAPQSIDDLRGMGLRLYEHAAKYPQKQGGGPVPFEFEMPDGSTASRYTAGGADRALNDAAAELGISPDQLNMLDTTRIAEEASKIDPTTYQLLVDAGLGTKYLSGVQKAMGEGKELYTALDSSLYAALDDSIRANPDYHLETTIDSKGGKHYSLRRKKRGPDENVELTPELVNELLGLSPANADSTASGLARKYGQ